MVDDRKRCTTSGKPIDEHTREIDPTTGMQKDYIVLCEDERKKGFVRPYRDSYKHLTCGAVTTMGRSLSETYARDPHFYSGTFCAASRARAKRYVSTRLWPKSFIIRARKVNHV